MNKASNKNFLDLKHKNNVLLAKIDNLQKTTINLQETRLSAQDDFRKDLGNNIARKMAKYNVQTEMDKKTGNITLD